MHRTSSVARRAVSLRRRLHSSRQSWTPQQAQFAPGYRYFSAATRTRLYSAVPAVETALPLEDEEELETLLETKSTEDDIFEGITSRPKKGGNWNPHDPLRWARDFGSRSKHTWQQLKPLIHLKPGDEGYFEHPLDESMEKVTLVRTKEQARKVVEKLMQADPTLFHACDTEVMAIDLKQEGPVGNGYVTCLSVYSGPDFDYGITGELGTVLWVDNLDEAEGVLQEFKPWLQDARHKKVWHNYGFDRHVLWNEGINVLGFGGDTMHMARLFDTSRAKMSGGYSLEALTGDFLGRRKKPMKEIFGVFRKRKDGSDGLIADIPPVEELQRNPRHRKMWIEYSCYDAESTWLLREKLQDQLSDKAWCQGKNLYEYYVMHMRQFGEVLTDMERRGIRVDARDYLAKVEVQAREDRAKHVAAFHKWAESKIGPDGLALNPASSIQLSTFLFGGAINTKTKEPTESERVFKVPREEISDEAMAAYQRRDEELRAQLSPEEAEPPKDDLDHMNAGQLKALCRQHKLKITGKKSDLQQRLRGHFLMEAQQQQYAGAATTNVEAEEPEHDIDSMTVVQLKALCKENGLKVSGKKAELQERLRSHLRAPKEPVPPPIADDFEGMSDDDLRDSCKTRGLPFTGTRKQLLEELRRDSSFSRELLAAMAPKDVNGYEIISKALEESAKSNSAISDILSEIKEKNDAGPKFIDVTVRSIKMTPEKFTNGGAPSATAAVLKKLAGDPFDDEPRFGTAYEFFNGGDEGREACEALYSLCAIGSIDTMIANFLTSLQSLADEQSRVHCSLNLNTETGRLSSRRPNLQNQPALEKDKYKIRKAFESSPGNNLIVADYGQLELRLLASMTNCKSMIEAFKLGGDFHSRTALDMFDYVKEKVDAGECLLEWDYSKGDPPKPLLKDMFASERRKAKTLNFSIAYGKTAHGLSADWGVSREEAEGMLQAWYKARPEVERWQKGTKAYARKYGITRTLMGRYRNLPEAMGRNRSLLGHAERASINTPIQGGAADVAMMAMNKINDNEKLKRLGWILLLQIHDEVILEGPEETAEEAFKEVVNCMENPWVFGLKPTAVPLLVDGSFVHKTWYDAK